MIKKIEPEELRVGMFVCGMERQAGKPIFFMNNILLKTQGDLEKMLWNGYMSVYIVVDDEPAAAPPVLPDRKELEKASSQTPPQALPDAVQEIPQDPLEAVHAIEELSFPERVEEQCPVIEACEEVEPEEASPAPGEVTPVEDTRPVEAVEAEEEAPAAAVEAAPAEEIEPEEEVKQAGVIEPIDAAPLETSFEEELKEARKVRDEAELLVREFLHDARLGKEVDTEKITGTVGRMVDSVFRNQDALTSLARLKSFDDYTFAHCVNVCILSLAVGRHMELDRADLGDLGTGAILHDIGKMLVPENVLNKPGKLTDDEFTVMKRHTEFGGEVLRGAKIKESSRLVALQHHERYDGSGYHTKRSGKGIHLFARIAAVVDVYDAMTSKRVYQSGMPPEEALKRLYLMRGTHFEPELVERLIKCLGIYPIGTLVELNTGELAVVKMVNRSHPLQPRIEIISDRKKKPCKTPVETELVDELGRWIVASRPGEFTPASNAAAS